MPPTWKYRSGRTTVDLTPELMAGVQRVITRTSPTLIPRLEAALRTTMTGIQAGWPVKTGRSKAAFAEQISVTRESIEASIINGAVNESDKRKRPYAHMVNRGHSWRDLVKVPMVTEADRIAQEIGPEIQALLSGSK